jgi:hypothetical protein
LIVRHIDRGDAKRAQQTIKFAAEPVAKRGVEGSQRFIEKENAGANRDGARQRHTLTLATGKLLDAALFKTAYIHQCDKLSNAGCSLLFADSADL